VHALEAATTATLDKIEDTGMDRVVLELGALATVDRAAVVGGLRAHVRDNLTGFVRGEFGGLDDWQATAGLRWRF